MRTQHIDIFSYMWLKTSDLREGIIFHHKLFKTSFALNVLQNETKQTFEWVVKNLNCTPALIPGVLVWGRNAKLKTTINERNVTKDLLSFVCWSSSVKTLRFTNLGEKTVDATVSPHLYNRSNIQVQRCYPRFRQRHSDYGDFNNGVGHVVKISIAESNPDSGLLTQPTFGFQAQRSGLRQ